MGSWGRWAAAGSAAIGAVVACSGGGSSPEDDCKRFVTLTQDCYAKAGKPVSLNSAGCSDPNTLNDQMKTQIGCALQHETAYCNLITISGSGDAGALNPRDPEYTKLNACYSAATLTGICKDAVLTLADCGVPFALTRECTGPSEALARCALDHKAGACSLYGARDASATTLTDDEKAFQQCQIDAQRAAIDASRD